MNIVDAFNGDMRRLLSFAWGMEACSPYPSGVEARLYKSDDSKESRPEGEHIPAPLNCLQGLTQMQVRGQASQIRGKLKRVLDTSTLALLELRLCIPVDRESNERKGKAYGRVVCDLIMTTTYSVNQIRDTCLVFGKMDTERKPNGGLNRKIHDMFNDALDMAEYRLKHNMQYRG